MPDRVEAFNLTVPAGSTPTAPTLLPINFNPGYVQEIDVTVPPGCAGLVGLALQVGGQNVIPRTPNTWIITDDYTFNWQYVDTIGTGKWGLLCYNTDIQEHTLGIIFQIDELYSFNEPVQPPIGI